MYLQFGKYIMVGFLNTFIGLLVIYLLIYKGFNIYIANIIGYLAGLINSYILNKKFVFKTINKSWKERYYFILVFILSYSLNLITLNILIFLDFNLYLSQFISMVVFTISGFLLNKFFVFKSTSNL